MSDDKWKCPKWLKNLWSLDSNLARLLSDSIKAIKKMTIEKNMTARLASLHK